MCGCLVSSPFKAESHATGWTDPILCIVPLRRPGGSPTPGAWTGSGPHSRRRVAGERACGVVRVCSRCPAPASPPQLRLGLSGLAGAPGPGAADAGAAAAGRSGRVAVVSDAAEGVACRHPRWPLLAALPRTSPARGRRLRGDSMCERSRGRRAGSVPLPPAAAGDPVPGSRWPSRGCGLRAAGVLAAPLRRSVVLSVASCTLATCVCSRDGWPVASSALCRSRCLGLTDKDRLHATRVDLSCSV